MAKQRTVYFCSECGNEYQKWQGQCQACGAWNTIVEQPAASAAAKTKTAASGRASYREKSGRVPKTLDQVETTVEIRFQTGLGELDRVLGGGAVVGSLVLVSGAPGIGKSTLLLQLCSSICRFAEVLYVSGEESERQIKLRAERLGVSGDGLKLLSETNLDDITECVRQYRPDVLIVDSIQTLYSEGLSTSPGSVAQVKECTMTLMQLAKGEGITVFIIGHVNKDGAIAGPKVLEHMVDCVLYFEGEQSTHYRLLRAAKNRFGSTNEIGVFEMHDVGLTEVPNPSEMLLSGRPKNTPGTCVACVMEGTRPLLAEVQTLITPTSFNVPRRVTDGFDYNRAMLLLAVVEKRGGLNIGRCDAYVNVIGGLTVDEPGADLPLVIAAASGFRDIPADDSTIAIGEVGLTGEIRSVTAMEQRLAEAARLGFSRAIIPYQGASRLPAVKGLELIKVKSIREAIKIALGE